MIKSTDIIICSEPDVMGVRYWLKADNPSPLKLLTELNYTIQWITCPSCFGSDIWSVEYMPHKVGSYCKSCNITFYCKIERAKEWQRDE